MDVPADAALVRGARPVERQDLRAYPGAGHTLDFEPDRGALPGRHARLAVDRMRRPLAGPTGGTVDADGDRARPVRGRPSVQGRLPARRRRADRPPTACSSGCTLDDGAEGWGECLPRAYVSGESREDAFALLRDTILPALVGPDVPVAPRGRRRSWRNATARPRPSGSPPRSRRRRPGAASTWPCSTRSAGRPASRSGRLGGRRRRPRRSRGTATAGSRPPARGWPSAVSLLKLRAFRFPHVKLKVERRRGPAGGPDGAAAARPPGRPAGRRQHGLGRRAGARRSSASCAAVGIELVRAADRQRTTSPGWRGWCGSRRPGIMVDEGLTDRESLQTLITHRACTAVNVRISKCGGLVGAYARCREALDAGLMLQVGCQVGESSLLSAAHLALLSALAPLTPGVRYAEGCFGRHLLREDPASPPGAVRLRRPPAAPPAGRRARGPGRPGDCSERCDGGPGPCHLGSQRGATDVASRTAAAVGEGPTVAQAFQRALPDPVQAQERLLRQILENNADTEFGRRHGFGGITAFQAVPGAGPHRQVRGPGALHQGGDERAAQPADQGNRRCCSPPPAGRRAVASTSR